MKCSNTVYEKSNAIESVALNRFRNTEYNALLADGNRQAKAQALADYLCEKFGIAKAKVQVANRPQPHTTSQRGTIKCKTLGTYAVGKDTITVYNLTAAKRQEVSIKVFADTLLHEFMHHYDIEYLRLGGTLHTAGFYKRITDLKKKLEK